MNGVLIASLHAESETRSRSEILDYKLAWHSASARGQRTAAARVPVALAATPTLPRNRGTPTDKVI